VGKFAAYIERLKTKSLQLQRGFAPYPPDQGLYPWTPLGAYIIALLRSPWHRASPQILRARTAAGRGDNYKSIRDLDNDCCLLLRSR